MTDKLNYTLTIETDAPEVHYEPRTSSRGEEVGTVEIRSTSEQRGEKAGRRHN